MTEYSTPLSREECDARGFGPAHPQHPEHSRIYSPKGEPLDPEALMQSLRGVGSRALSDLTEVTL